MFFSRPNNGAIIEFNPDDLVDVQKAIDEYQIDFSNVEEITVDSVINTINNQLTQKKIKQGLPHGFQLNLPATLVPKKNEYQNFGFMQAIDHIKVLLELEKKNFNFVQNYTVNLVETSHGGYLAHLIAKYAPHKIDNVIDNSSYTKSLLNYVVGKSLDQEEYRYRIRSFDDKEHLEDLEKIYPHETKYISYHSSFDSLASLEDKIELYKVLNRDGEKAVLNIINSENQVDGKFIKTLSHGMGMSLKELVNKELPFALKEKNNKKETTINLQFRCRYSIYKFNYKEDDLQVSIEKL